MGLMDSGTSPFPGAEGGVLGAGGGGGTVLHVPQPHAIGEPGLVRLGALGTAAAKG